MDLSTTIFLTSGLLLGWSLGANDAANVFGTAVGTRMVRFATAATVCSVFVVLGAVLSGAGAAQTLGVLGSINAIAGAFMAALSAAGTVYAMTKWGLPVSTSQAIVGAIIGWNLFSGAVTDTRTLVTIVSTWVACPILAGVIAVVLLKLVSRGLRVIKLHLLRLDAYTRMALLLAGAFGAYSLGANNIANVMGVFVEVSPFTELTVGGTVNLTSKQQLFLLGALAIAAGVFTYSKAVMITVGTSLLPMTPLVAWVVVIAHSVVLFVFASEGLENVLARSGLPTIPLVPVSSSQAVVGAVVGIGLLRGGRDIDWRLLRNIGAGWVTTPVISAAVCFVSLFFLQNVFNQQVYREVRYELTAPVISKLASRGVPTHELAALRGDQFDSAREFLDAVHGRGFFGERGDRLLLHYARVHPLHVDSDGIENLDGSRLGDAQIAAVEGLAGRRFRHEWQLAEALAGETQEWSRKERTTVNKPYNQRIERDLEYLYRLFSEKG